MQSKHFLSEDCLSAAQARVMITRELPEKYFQRPDGVWFLDFGRDAFGTLELNIPLKHAASLTVRLGEVPTPKGDALFVPPPVSPACSRRFRELRVEILPGQPHRVELPLPTAGDAYQTRGYDCAGAQTIASPKHIGEMMPFRYVEVVGAPAEFYPEQVTRLMAHYPFDDQASEFQSTDLILNRIWDFCKYTVKATSCFGIYIDGDRERLVYAGDAWVAQLAHAALDSDYTLGRVTLARLLKEGSWCYEYAPETIAMVWTDYQYTGDVEFLRRHYDALQPLTLSDLKRADGLLVTGELLRPHPLFDKLHNRDQIFRDLVDWPRVLRDGCEIGRVNICVNVLHWFALRCLADMAAALKRDQESAGFRAEATRVKAAIQRVFFNPEQGLYVDCEGSTHSSLHANAFPLALGLVVREHRPRIAEFLVTRGMQCGLRGALYLLEALCRAGFSDQARALMTADNDRSWLGMLNQGATMTMECWNEALKPSQTWTHVWGASPAYIIARHLMGVRPMTPGFTQTLVAPQPGSLARARLLTPTLHGGIDVQFEQTKNTFRLEADIPDGITAEARIPVPRGMRPLPVAGFTFAPHTHRLVRQHIAPGHHVFQAEFRSNPSA